MILNENDIKHPDLRAFWVTLSGGEGSDGGGLPADMLKRISMILLHLDSARSMRDIAGGLGRVKRHHKLSGYPNRYAMEVNGNWRITYDVEDVSTGVVTVIDFENYH